MNTNKTLLAASICAALSAGSAHAATFNVTTNADDGPGSLRQALIDAGANAEPDTIELSAISGQTISLSSGALYAGEDVITINGAGVTIDAGGNSRVIETYVADLTLNNLTITGGNTVGGKYSGGGGIYSFDGDLTLNNTTVTGNMAGGSGGGIAVVGYEGDLTISDSVISDNSGAGLGGGLFAYSYFGSLSISGSTISGNSVEDGGVVQPPPMGQTSTGSNLARRLAARLNDPDQRPAALRGGPSSGGEGGGGFAATGYGDVDIIDSTITGNSAAFGAGLVALSGYGAVNIEGSTFSANQADEFAGAGVLQTKYETVLSNSTVSGNTSGDLIGGIAFYSGTGGKGMTGGNRGVEPLSPLRIEFSTITGNSALDIGGVAISTELPALIVGSVIAGNIAPTDPDIGFEPGSVGTAEVSWSLLGSATTSGTLTLDPASTNLQGEDPLLGPLGDNGGPTPTHLPLFGSPLIDAIAPGQAGCGTTVSVDQRGEARPQGAGCDIGALESLAGVPPQPEALPVPVFDRFGIWLMAGLLALAGLFGVRRERASRSR